MTEILEIPINQITIGQHRQRTQGEDEEISELAASIDRLGVLVPIILQKEGDTFHLVSGHRRILAALRVGLSDIPCIIQDSDQARATETAFAENFFRKDLSPVELAAAIRDCLDQKLLTIEELAHGFHRSQQWIMNQASMTTWPDEILAAIHTRALSVAAASNLALISEPAYRAFLLHQAIESGASARVTSAWYQAWRLSRPASEAISSEPADGRSPPQPIVPQASCIFCLELQRSDALNYMPICGPCFAKFQATRAEVAQQTPGG